MEYDLPYYNGGSRREPCGCVVGSITHNPCAKCGEYLCTFCYNSSERRNLGKYKSALLCYDCKDDFPKFDNDELLHMIQELQERCDRLEEEIKELKGENVDIHNNSSDED